MTIGNISICIPTYEEPEKLKRCVDSIFQQTHPFYEIVITDDSRDDSVEKLVQIYSAGKKVRFYRNPAPKGSPGNWNEAIRKASGDLIVLMHHDDWFYNSSTLENLVKHMIAESADLVFAQSYNINAAMEIISKNDPDKKMVRVMKADIQTLFYANRIGAPSAVLFRNKDVFFDTRLKWLVDVEFYIRYLKGRSLCYARDAIVGIGISASQMTRSCLGNLDVELGENLLVYRTLKHSWKNLASDFRHFSRLFWGFELKMKDFSRFDPESRVKFFYFLYSLWVPIKKILKRFLVGLSSPKNRKREA